MKKGSSDKSCNILAQVHHELAAFHKVAPVVGEGELARRRLAVNPKKQVDDSVPTFRKNREM